MRAFVAMPFHKNFWPVWETIRDACEHVSIEPRRVDQLPQVNNIAATIFREIENTDLVIVDFSGDKDLTIPNPNVVTEATHARNLEKPMLILTQNTASLPFDWRTHRAVIYENNPRELLHFKKVLTENLQGILPRLRTQATTANKESPQTNNRRKGKLIIYVGNLPKKSRTNLNEELKELFQRFGAVDKVELPLDRKTGEFRGFGFIEMSNASEGEEAISLLDNAVFQGGTLRVNEARRRITQEIVTSSSHQIHGYRIIRQIEMVTYSGDFEDEIAKRELKKKTVKLGANGIINLRITRSRDGYVNMQGDAVVVEELDN